MSFLGKLFGKKPATDSLATAKVGVDHEHELITVYDAYGREFKITRQQWRDNVLHGSLENSRDDPDQLYSLLSSALQDGFAEDVLPYARHLQKIDPLPSRAAALLGAVYLDLKELDAAERTLRDYLQRHGEEAYVLTNLSKVFAQRGRTEEADATLWRALELDPNQEHALGVYWTNARERGGDEAGLESLRKISAIAGSWRAQIWIARSLLDQNDLEGALRLYDQALEVAPRPVPADLLMQLSGDLGNRGHLVELLKRTTPLFDAATHGLLAGNNLIKANIDLGRMDHAKAIVDQLYAVNRPDFQETLSYWETEIAKSRVERENRGVSTPLSMTMLVFQGPIWLAASSPAAALFPAKNEDAVVVCCLGSTVETSATGEPHMQIADATGRLSRSAAIFLCEQLHLLTSAVGRILQPWIPPGGLAIAGMPWDAETAIDQAKASTPPGDYVVVTHLVTKSQPGELQFRLLRCIDGSLLDNDSYELDLDAPECALQQLAERLLASIVRHAAVERVDPPPAYCVPAGAGFTNYQLRIEQALAVRASAIDGTRSDFLSGEREIITGMLHLCLEEPENISTRLLLLNTLRSMTAVRPTILDEFRDKVRQLEREHPVPAPACQAVHEMVTMVFG